VTRSSADSAEELPEVDFSTFLLSLAHSILVHLGEASPPGGEHVEPDLLLARQTVELLGLLRDKTKGNLTGAEERLLEQLLVDVRSRYAEHVRKV
jgi:hypothetical protein